MTTRLSFLLLLRRMFCRFAEIHLGLLAPLAPRLPQGLLGDFAQDRHAHGSWVVSSTTLIQFALDVRIYVAQVRGMVSVLTEAVIKCLPHISTSAVWVARGLPRPSIGASLLTCCYSH
ncbi:hypothetical protein E2C01_090249 [Portunus trituberculatus]|uniref:Secreted protein n=1 Tax=Portunus trituberculatus TaxID=210409 RepID=A0A5B7JRP9_PORTR|nr:hypothetical protein [Portunus trituberculatus]